MKKLLTPPNLTTLAWFIALIGVCGSLYYSGIERYIPCELCWLQRVFLYPQTVILGIALWRNDWQAYRYSLPLLGIGWVIALYHTALYYTVNFIHPMLTAAPCDVSGVSCTTRYVEYFGFISIPLLSLTAFTIMILCLLTARNHLKKVR